MGSLLCNLVGTAALTGDGTNFGLWIGLMVVMLLVIVGVVVYSIWKKKKTDGDDKAKEKPVKKVEDKKE